MYLIENQQQQLLQSSRDSNRNINQELQENSVNQQQQPQGSTTDIDNINSLDQVRKVKGQVEKDVLLLRNRVRMLQMEHEKAQKKIMETQKKAKQLEDLKARNDQKFIMTYIHFSN